MAETNDPQEGAFEGTRLDAPNNVQSKLDPQGALEPGRSEALDNIRAKAAQLRRRARANYRAMEGWQRVRTPEHWERINEESVAAYESGEFFLARSGAERFLDPNLMATLLSLRQGLLGDARVPTAEKMLVDVTMITYQHILRVNGWIGDLMARIDHEFFGDDAFTELAREGWRQSNRKFSVEERVRRLSEQLLPVLDRLSRMLIRNQKAIQDLRQGQMPTVAIQVEQQVTVNTPKSTSTDPQRLSPREVTITETTPIEAGPESARAAIAAAPASDSRADVAAAGVRREHARSSTRSSELRRHDT